MKKDNKEKRVQCLICENMVLIEDTIESSAGGHICFLCEED